MRVVLAHPTGNEFFRAAATGFYDAGMLQSLYTSIACFPGTFLYKLGASKIFAEIHRRALDERFKSLSHTRPLKEAGRLLAIKTGSAGLITHEKGIFSVDAVYAGLDKHVAKRLKKEKIKGASAIYAYEDGAAYSFQAARNLGLKCIYDLPIGYWRCMHSLLSTEKELNPDWAVTLDGLKDSQEKLNRKDREILLADIIIVASSFTLKTLKQYPGKTAPIKVVPYGFPPAREKKYRNIHDKIRLLFVGGLSQRKGLSYLFEAIKGLEIYVSLTIVGRGAGYNCKPLEDNLKKHTWIETLSHTQVLKLMREHDVLIFPSLFEGFGQVITEAMAQGTPVITTERTAGPDIIRHGENGWLVSAGSSEAIRNILEEILFRPELISGVGKEALETAMKRPWSVYGRELAEVVGGVKSETR